MYWYVGGRRRVCDHAGVHQSTSLRVLTYHLRTAASLSAAQIKSVVDQQRQRRARMQHPAVAQWRQGTLCCCDRSVLKPPIYIYFPALNLGVSLQFAFSALTLLVGPQEEHPVCENFVIRCWRGYLSEARCKPFPYGPADATATCHPIISCFIKIQIGFTRLVQAYPDCAGKEAVKRMLGCTS